MAFEAGCSGIGGAVVACEADQIDSDTRRGWVSWSPATRVVPDPERLDRYEELLVPWVEATLDQAISIRAGMVTGFRLDRIYMPTVVSDCGSWRR